MVRFVAMATHYKLVDEGSISLCKPVDVPPRPELVAFTTESSLHWQLYNYTYITTLAIFEDLTKLDPQVR